MIPSPDDIRRADDALQLASTALIRFAEDGDERHWNRATGLLQDACEAIGYEFRPLPTQPPATAEQLFTEWDFASSRGQL
jgi:hypothetical protein